MSGLLGCSGFGDVVTVIQEQMAIGVPLPNLTPSLPGSVHSGMNTVSDFVSVHHCHCVCTKRLQWRCLLTIAGIRK